MTGSEDADRIAALARSALGAFDLDGFADLLAPDVSWGAPGDGSPECRNRGEVLEWYRRGRDAGVRARVLEASALGPHSVLIGMAVSGRPGAADLQAEAERWQVLTVANGLVAEITAFELRADAIAYAGPEGPVDG